MLGTLLYKPCSIDIIEYKITAVVSYVNKTLYQAKATNNVGACGRIEILLYQEKFGNFRFMDCVKDYEHEKGLQDMVEGLYYVDKQQARLAYYCIHETNARIALDNKRRLYDQAKENLDVITKILKEIKESITEIQTKDNNGK